MSHEPTYTGDNSNLTPSRGSRARVVITGLTEGGYSGPGKVDPQYFYPTFCKTLNFAGIETCFVRTIDDIKRAVTHERTILLHIYNEEKWRRHAELLRVNEDELGVVGVWNSTRNAGLIADKRRTNMFLSQIGVRVPEVINEPRSDIRVFSNVRIGSQATTYLLEGDQPSDPLRYNTRFVDTRRVFRGSTYHSTVRLMCVGSQLLIAFVRLRDAAEGSASVHNKDTPLDVDLITYFHKLLVTDRLTELKALGQLIGNALGPGFYCHDLVTDAVTGEIHVCEIGLKLSDYTYKRRLGSIRDRLPDLQLCFSHRYVREAASLFVSECARLGWLVPEADMHAPQETGF